VPNLLLCSGVHGCNELFRTLYSSTARVMATARTTFMYFPLLYFPVAQQPKSGLGRLLLEVSRSHLDTRHSVGLLWTSDHSVAETSTWEHTNTHKRQTAMPPGGIGTHEPSKRSAEGPRLRPRSHWDRHIYVNLHILRAVDSWIMYVDYFLKIWNFLFIILLLRTLLFAFIELNVRSSKTVWYWQVSLMLKGLFF
jgi:hypothetical protein